jgi:chromosome partitioning protein
MMTLFANFKGGTGKSTIVFNMAVWRMAQGLEVTVCDLDPQRTLTDVADIRGEDGIEPRLRVVHKLPAKGKARGDWLIDVGTSDMKSLRAGIRAADRIVIPVTPSQADIWATQHFLSIVREERGDKGIPPMFAFVNRADPHPRSRENAESLEALQSLDLIAALPQKMVQRLAFRRSFSEGLAVFELEPGGKAAGELDALARAAYASESAAA